MAEYIKDIRKFGATVVVLNKNKQILLQLRADTKEWGLPGGAMELAESLEQTAERELLEETGLRAENFKFLDLLSGQDLYFKYPHGDEVYNVISVYLAEGTNGKLSMTDGESLDLQYFSPTDLPANIDERAQLIITKHF